MNALCDEGLVTRLPARNTKVWALDPARLHVTTDAAVMRCANSSRTLVVPAREADLWHGVPCLDLAAEDRYVKCDPGRPTWAGRLYGQAEIRRIVSAEHTALVSRPDRDHLQERFAASDVKPWEPNLLSATPTLELGVDIGDLSTVVMCSVPPGAGELRSAHRPRGKARRERVDPHGRGRAAARSVLLRRSHGNVGTRGGTARDLPERARGSGAAAHRRSASIAGWRAAWTRTPSRAQSAPC